MPNFATTALGPTSPLFRGRQAELARLIQLCQDEVSSYVVLYGGRQNGKTSLLMCLEVALAGQLHLCRIDFQLIKGATPAEAVAFLAAQLAQTLPLAADPGPMPNGPALLRYLEQTLAPSAVARCVLLLDEWGALPPATRQALANVLRAIFHRRLVRPALAKLQVLLSGGIELYDLVITEASSLHNICEEVYLTDLAEDEAVALVAEVLASLGVDAELAAALGRAVYARVAGHPYLTQRIGSLLDTGYRRGVALTVGQVDMAVRAIQRGDPLLRRIRDDLREHGLEDAARRLLTAPPRFTRLDDAMARLELIGLAKPADERWALRNPLLAEVFCELLGVRAAGTRLRVPNVLGKLQKRSPAPLKPTNPRNGIPNVLGKLQKRLTSTPLKPAAPRNATNAADAASVNKRGARTVEDASAAATRAPQAVQPPPEAGLLHELLLPSRAPAAQAVRPPPETVLPPHPSVDALMGRSEQVPPTVKPRAARQRWGVVASGSVVLIMLVVTLLARAWTIAGRAGTPTPSSEGAVALLQATNFPAASPQPTTVLTVTITPSSEPTVTSIPALLPSPVSAEVPTQFEHATELPLPPPLTPEPTQMEIDLEVPQVPSTTAFVSVEPTPAPILPLESSPTIPISILPLGSSSTIPAPPESTPAPPESTPAPPALVHIPAGPFLMGSSGTLAEGNEKPQHRLELPDFWIGKTEVTNAQFQPFVEGDGYTNPAYWTEAGWAWREEENITQPAYWDDIQWNGDTQPVVGISWFEAVAYCRWLSAQTGQLFYLPSEAEWEKAARGPDGRIWPWGNTWEIGRANSSEAGVGQTTLVGGYPDSASPYGALDIAGNVWEWCATLWRKDYPYLLEDEWREAYLVSDARRVARGGAWTTTQTYVRGAARINHDPRFRIFILGLRVASRSP